VPSQAPPPTSHPHQPARMPPYTPSPAMHGYYQPMPANPSNPPTKTDFYNPSMGYTPPYPAYYSAPGSSSSYQAGYQMGKPAAQYPPAQGNPPQQSGLLQWARLLQPSSRLQSSGPVHCVIRPGLQQSKLPVLHWQQSPELISTT
jgi:hypothetical protein